MEKVYVVSYSEKYFDEWQYEMDIFATTDKDKAIKYVHKFNRILSEWRDYYHSTNRNHVRCIRLDSISPCYCKQLQLR